MAFVHARNERRGKPKLLKSAGGMKQTIHGEFQYVKRLTFLERTGNEVQAFSSTLRLRRT